MINAINWPNRKFMQHLWVFLGAIIFIQLLNMMFGLNQLLGVTPGDFSSLWNVMTYSFVHGGLFHLVMNVFVLYFFAIFLEHLGSYTFWKLTFLGAIGSGLVVWLFGAGLTVGASGIGFAYLGYTIVITQFMSGRQVDSYKKNSYMFLGLNLIITLIVPFVSISGHLGGLVVGMLLAWMDKKKYKDRMIY